MDEDRKTAATIGLITVYGGHALLKKKAGNRVDQVTAGSVSALSYYVGSGLMNLFGLKESGLVRNILEAGVAYAGAELGIRVSHWGKEKLVDSLKKDVQDSYQKTTMLNQEDK